MGHSKIFNAKVKEIGSQVRLEANGRVYLFTMSEWNAARRRAVLKNLVPLMDTFTEKFIG